MKQQDSMNKLKEIQLSVPNLDMDIIPKIKECITSGWVSTGGRFITEFENKVKDFTGAGGARSTQSGTAGLHLALRVLGVQFGDEVIVPTLTFIAAVNPVKYLGAEPIFMDCGDDLNIDPDKIELFLEEECTYDGNQVVNKITGKTIKGIIVVHVFGNPVDMERIMDIAEKYNLFVLEDATEALGSYYTKGRYQGKYCGTIGHMGVYSFNANKIITCGNGGMVVSDNLDLLDEVNYLGVQAKTDPLRYIHDDIGYNYRLTNISAAFGISQMARIEDFIKTKKTNYYLYKEELDKINGLKLWDFNEGTEPNYWFYSLSIDEKIYGYDREQVLQKLAKKGIHTRPVWGLIHEQMPYLHNQSYKIEKANVYADNILNIPCSSNLTNLELNFVISALKDI